VVGPKLSHFAHERLANPPLRAMLGQAQFEAILRLQKVEAVADFQDAIRHLFPKFAVEQQIQIQLAIPQGEGEAAAVNRAANYRFTNDDGTWSVVLSPTALTLEAGAGVQYSSYDDFADLFRQVWPAVLEHLRPGDIKRQGLRYIDHIEGERSFADWAQYINADLLGGMAGEVLGSGLKQALSELIYADETDLLIFRHGIAQAGPENAQGYLLDFDAVNGAAVDASDLEQLMARFEESHTVLYDFFRWCLTDHALEEFGRGSD
jgi:uncharacterized protein (TIGR04255 family)